MAATTEKKKKAPVADRASRLAAHMATDDLFKDMTDILPNDYVEPMFPTGSIVFDEVLGLGGGIKHHGRMLMAQGPEHTGKTTICIEFAAAFQRYYGDQGSREPVFFFDYERTITPQYLWDIGLDPALTHIVQPSSVQESITVLMNLLERDECRCFIFDSINMIFRDIKKEDVMSGKHKVDDVQPGDHARFMTNFLKMLTPLATKRNALLLFVNQQTTRIVTNKQEQRKQQWAGGFANLDYDVKGGKAPKQFASYQIETTKGAAVEGAYDDKEQWLYEDKKLSSGIAKSPSILRNHARILKNKVSGGGYREFDFYLRAGAGVDDWISVRWLAHHYGMIFFMGQKQGYRIGTEEHVITIYPTKADAIKALVLDQDMDVLLPLRQMVVERVRQDDLSFRFNPSLADRVAAGDEEAETELAGVLGGDDTDLQDAEEL